MSFPPFFAEPVDVTPEHPVVVGGPCHGRPGRGPRVFEVEDGGEVVPYFLRRFAFRSGTLKVEGRAYVRDQEEALRWINLILFLSQHPLRLHRRSM